MDLLSWFSSPASNNPDNRPSYSWFGSLFFQPSKSATEITETVGESIGGFFGSTTAGILKPLFPMLLIGAVILLIVYVGSKSVFARV